MTMLNPSLPSSLGGTTGTRRRAVSLRGWLSGRMHQTWLALERIGQRRAAPELRRAAQRLADRHPELAGTLARTADDWTRPAPVADAVTGR